MYAVNPVKKCPSNYWPHFCMQYSNYNKDVLPRRTRSSGKLRLPSIKFECTKKSFFIMVVYFLTRFRFQRRIQGEGCNPHFRTFSNLSGYPCLPLFDTKNNIMSYNISSSPIDQYKRFIPLLDSSSKCKIDFWRRSPCPPSALSSAIDYGK